MGYCPLIVALITVFILTIFLLNKYGNWKRQHVFVSLSVFIGWFFSFIIIFVLPLDVAITLYNRCLWQKEHFENTTTSNVTLECEEPGGLVPNTVLLMLWRIVYWTAQVLTWLILPLMQSYVSAGDFSALGRLKTAAVNNALYYGAYLLVFIVFLIYAVFKGVNLNREHLAVVIVSASNTWGLLLLVVLLGYGLVELPRQIWLAASPEYSLQKTYFNVDKLSTEKHDAEDGLKEVYREARAVLNLLKNDHLLRGKAQTIVSKFPEEAINELFPNRSGADFQSIGDADRNAVSSEKYLIRLHQRVIDAVQCYQRTNAHWSLSVEKALFLEELTAASSSGASIPPSDGFSIFPENVRTVWYTKARTPFSRIASVLFWAMTVLVLFSECTFFLTQPTISPGALIIDRAAQGFHYKYTQLLAICLISYLCACAYFTIFRLRIYSYYHLDPHHNTDENSLLFSAMLLCRLTPPICLNFLGMIHLDSHITGEQSHGVETQFTKLMGHLDLLPVVAKGINIYLPMAILVFCALTYYKLGTRLLHALGIDQFVADDHTAMELVSAGRSLVGLERSKRTRAERREQRERQWTQRMGAAADRLRGGLRRSPSEERRPIVGDVDEELGYDSAPARASANSRFAPPSTGTVTTPPAHPNSANFFDDM